MRLPTMSVVCLASLLAISQQRGYVPMAFPPVDESKADPDLMAFRDRLLSIAKREDLQELVAMSSSQTRAASGETAQSRMRRDFTEVVQPPWREFKEALSLGGAFTTIRGAVSGRREFCAPYVYSAFPEDPGSIGVMQLPWAITRKNTPVYDAPRVTARIVGRLGFSLVEFLDYMPPGAAAAGDNGWVLVSVSSSRQGFVPGDAARSPEDWHVCLAKEGAGWRVTEFSRDRFVLKPGR